MATTTTNYAPYATAAAPISPIPPAPNIAVANATKTTQSTFSQTSETDSLTYIIYTSVNTPASTGQWITLTPSSIAGYTLASVASSGYRSSPNTATIPYDTIDTMDWAGGTIYFYNRQNTTQTLNFSITITYRRN